ncbi:MAG: hydroxymethylbilane synthase [Clostridiales Family XIII bacterium]|nr:hydroxymethylbilane synthase [Clostridiales Family XIII bacterium]
MNTVNVKTIRIGTRGSKLAMAQTARVIARLNEILHDPNVGLYDANVGLHDPNGSLSYDENHGGVSKIDATDCGVLQRADLMHDSKLDINFEIVTINTKGDTEKNADLTKMSGTGVFVKAIEEALLNGEIDMAVHSLKDVPSVIPAELILAAYPEREDVRDCVIMNSKYNSIHGLPAGAVVGTSSARRKYLLMQIRDDLDIQPIRGNIETRMRKVLEGHYDATILAVAGLKRIGFFNEAKDENLPNLNVEFLPADTWIPAVGQGALALECRSDDEALIRLLSEIDDICIRKCVEVERDFLRQFGEGCALPLGAYAYCDDENDDEKVILTSFAAMDGTKCEIIQTEQTK